MFDTKFNVKKETAVYLYSLIDIIINEKSDNYENTKNVDIGYLRILYQLKTINETNVNKKTILSENETLYKLKNDTYLLYGSEIIDKIRNKYKEITNRECNLSNVQIGAIKFYLLKAIYKLGYLNSNQCDDKDEIKSDLFYILDRFKEFNVLQ